MYKNTSSLTIEPLNKQESIVKVINILVKDSHHTSAIAKRLRKYFSGKAVCHEGLCPEGVKIDLFFFSATDIISGPGFTSQIVNTTRSDKAKVIAMSTIEAWLDQLKKQSLFKIDFAIPKRRILIDLNLEEERSSVREAEGMLDEILASVTC